MMKIENYKNNLNKIDICNKQTKNNICIFIACDAYCKLINKNTFIFLKLFLNLILIHKT